MLSSPDTATANSTPEMYMGSTQILPSAPKLKTGVNPMPAFTDTVNINQDSINNLIANSGAEIKLPETQAEVATFLDNVDDDYIKNWYQGLSEDEQKKWKPLYEAVDAGVGAKTFAWNIMQDTEALKQLFPNVPQESLPQGASLVGQLKDVEDSLKEDFKIDSLKNNMDRLIEEGVTIEDNLTDYITARDKYIDRLDNMIDTAKDQMVNMDMANPYVAKKMNGYMNYLYIMKGRQQKTYTDFLNSGINQYNQQVKVATDLYNNAYDRFESALKDKTAVTKEQHDFMTDMLEEMYTNIEGREKSTLEMDKLRYEVMQEKYQAASDMIDSLTGADNVTFTSKDKTTSQKNFIAINPTKTLADWKLLSGEEKLSYLDGEDTNDLANIDFYVGEIVTDKKNAKKDEVSYEYADYDEETETTKINWSKVPADIRPAVKEKLLKLSKEAQAKKEAEGIQGEQEPEDDGILSRLKRLLGMNDKNNSD
jgi:hypothetical protein